MILDAYGRPVVTENDLRASVAQEANNSMRQFLVDTVADPQQHALAIADGYDDFKRVINKCLGPLYGNNRGQVDDLANGMYRFLKENWRTKYGAADPKKFLDGLHVPTPLSAKEQEKEIEDAWELQIDSSESAMRQHYEGSARTRKGSWLGSRVRALFGR